MLNITALIISNNRPDYLKESVNSLIKFNVEIFVVINGFNESSVNFLNTVKKAYLNIDFMLFHEQTNKSDARNSGIDKINSDVIYFLDDDAFIDTDNIKILQNKFEQYPVIGVIGGPNITPTNSSRFQKITGIMLSTFLMSYKMSTRYINKGTDRLTDDCELILCNLAIKKNLFTKYNLKFEKLLHYNEENLLLEQLKRHNVQMLYSPDLSVCHHRRKTLKSFLLQIYNSGKGRAVMTIMMPSSFKLFYTFPSLFILYLASVMFGKMTFVLLDIYVLITIYNVISTYFLYNLKLLDITLMFAISFASHIFYGIGFIFGIIQGSIWKTKKVF